ncbi:hypothetical protein J6590_005426 [Homalodisca vitripennis]|nr:hypothetical protein J6590_005426 [Homalodisca vitripennis]
MCTTRKNCTTEKQVRTVPEIRDVVDELVAIGKIEDAEGKVLIDTGAQVSLVKRGASSAELTKPDGYLAVLGCDILGKGNGEINVEHGLLRLYGGDIWLNRIKKGEAVPDPNRPSASCAPPKQQRYVYCCSDVKIPPRCEKIIQVKTNRCATGSDDLEGKDVVIEPPDFIMHGVYLARTLTKVKGNRCWVKTVNASAEELTLPKNLKLGTLDRDFNPVEGGNPVRQKLLVLADSHGRGLQEILSERLPRNFDVEVFFMPNGKLKQVTSKFGSTIDTLTENDTVILIGGTNDVDKCAPYPLTLKQAFENFPVKWKARVTVLSIFDRYDQDLKSELGDANGILKSIIQNLAKNRDKIQQGRIEFLDLKGKLSHNMYTKHGLHLNQQGKVKLATVVRDIALHSYKRPQARVGMVSRSDESDLEACLDEKLRHLPSHERDLVKSTLMEFKNVLAHSEDQPLGCTSAVTHVIRTRNAAPIYKKAYRVPYHQKATLDELLLSQMSGQLCTSEIDRMIPSSPGDLSAGISDDGSVESMIVSDIPDDSDSDPNFIPGTDTDDYTDVNSIIE